MKVKNLTKVVGIALISSILFQSCIGSFKMFNKVQEWNNGLGNKWINELVFLVLWILPVYEITVFLDVVILNSIEFWTGSNPMAYDTKEVSTENGNFLIETTPAGHKITNLATNEAVSFKFNDVDKSWSLETKDSVQPLFTCIDETHVKMKDGNIVTLSEAGLMAYQNAVGNQSNMALK